MGLDSSLGVASSSLANITQSFAVISQNVANADTPGFATEQSTVQSLTAGGIGYGAQSGPTRLATDASLQAELFSQNGANADASATQTALTQLQPALGTVGQGNDLGSLLTNVQNGFSSLLNDPSSQPQQAAVVDAAQSLTTQINALASAYGTARQTAQNNTVSQVAQLNSALGQIGSISSKIVVLEAQGGSTAGLENQRNAQMTIVSGLVGAKFFEQPNGNMLVFTAAGAELPTDTPNPLSIASASMGPSVYYPGGAVPGIMLDNVDITSQMGGGSIGANITLRDSTLPTYAGELDEFSQTLASNFAAQGLTLFTDPQGNLPASGGTPVQANYLGFSSSITVNPAVVANPALVRDGTQAIAGSATGASAFTPNPDGLAGFTGMIDRVLNFALGPDVQTDVAQPAANTTGLGASGTLSAPFSAPATLGDFTTDITASQSADSANASTNATNIAVTQQAFAGQLQSATGVDMDSQMSLMIQLQNAYGANAKVISTIQAMQATLLESV